MKKIEIANVENIAGSLLHKASSELNEFGRIKKLCRMDIVNLIQCQLGRQLFNDDYIDTAQVTEGTVIWQINHDVLSNEYKYLIKEKLSSDLDIVLEKLNNLYSEENENPTEYIPDKNDIFSNFFPEDSEGHDLTVSKDFYKKLENITSIFNDENPYATYEVAIYDKTIIPV